jgi:predicted DCC family thiol-disulfide oxidoreductase YuxK
MEVFKKTASAVFGGERKREFTRKTSRSPSSSSPETPPRLRVQTLDALTLAHPGGIRDVGASTAIDVCAGDVTTGPHIGKIVVFVDGTCVFCNRLVSFILDRDREGLFFFSHLQSSFAREARRRHGHDPDDMDGIYALVDAGTPTERLCVDGAAGREIWPRLFRIAIVLRWVPLFVLNLFYRSFAKVRFSLFGRYDTCKMPTPEERARCIE